MSRFGSWGENEGRCSLLFGRTSTTAVEAVIDGKEQAITRYVNFALMPDPWYTPSPSPIHHLNFRHWYEMSAWLSFDLHQPVWRAESIRKSPSGFLPFKLHAAIIFSRFPLLVPLSKFCLIIEFSRYIRNTSKILQNPSKSLQKAH